MKRASALSLLISCGLVVAACNAIFGLDEGELDGSVCADGSTCDDDNPCTVDQCVKGSCVSIGGPNVVVTEDAQVPGDCRRLRCDAEGALEEVVDDSDVPDDGNDCTVEECRSGEVFGALVDFGSRCDNGNGFCDTEGRCGDCISEADCPASNFCVSFACELGQCAASFAPRGAPLPTDEGGDCRREVCDGNGMTTFEDDPTDLPLDGNDCTQDLCTGAPLSPSNPAVTDGSSCGAGASTECQGGICVGCSDNGDCSPSTTCATWSCNTSNQQCEVVYAVAQTPLPAAQQQSGDCQRLVCNGTGGLSTQNDNADVFDDGNACTTDSCSQGSPIHTDRPLNTVCAGGFCNATGTCVQCNSAGQCPPGANACQVADCAANLCTIVFRASGYVIAMQTPGDCKTAVCNGSGAITSQTTSSDVPPDDGNDCTSSVCVGSTPTHQWLYGTPCSGGFCSSGGCVECLQSSHCPSSGECCNVSYNQCVLNGSGCTLSS